MTAARIIIALLSIGLVASSSQGSRRNGNNGASFFPIRELGPSLAASVAGGTIIAARSHKGPSLPNNGEDNALNNDDDDCLVVLVRSPIVSEPSGSGTEQNVDAGNLTIASVFGSQEGAKQNSNDADTTNNNQQGSNNNYYHGLSFLPNGPVNFPFLSPSSSSSSQGSNNNNLRILDAPSGLLVAATGFAPDADHILNVAAGRVLSRISIYDGEGGGKSVDPHRLVREDLSSLMIDAAMSDSGRPLGLQLLVIGQTALSQRSRLANNNNDDDVFNALEIYTIDPSGGWRSCVGIGTAVGRGAERVRSSLFKLPNKCEDTSFGWKGALDRAMMAAVDALEQNDDSDGASAGQQVGTQEDGPRGTNYGAVVIFGSSDGFRRQISVSKCASINSDIVKECYSRCCEKIRRQKVPT